MLNLILQIMETVKEPVTRQEKCLALIDYATKHIAFLGRLLAGLTLTEAEVSYSQEITPKVAQYVNVLVGADALLPHAPPLNAVEAALGFKKMQVRPQTPISALLKPQAQRIYLKLTLALNDLLPLLA